MSAGQLNDSSLPRSGAKLVSVIVPAFNSAPFIKEALDSIFSQTYSNMEVIVIDDGSTDDTPGLVVAYGRGVTLLRQPNRGPASARNLGIQDSHGDYVAFLDADDLWLPDKLKVQVDYLESHPEAGLVFADCQKFGDSGGYVCGRGKRRRVSRDKLFDLLLSQRFVAMSSVVALRGALDAAGLFDEALIGAEDYNLYLRLARQCEFGFIDRALVRKRLHGGCLSLNLERMRRDEICNIHKIARIFPDARVPVKELVGAIEAKFGRYYFASRQFDKAQDCLLRAFVRRPALWRVWPYLAATMMPESWCHKLIGFKRQAARLGDLARTP